MRAYYLALALCAAGCGVRSIGNGQADLSAGGDSDGGSGNDDLSGPVRTAHLLNMGSSFSNPAGTCPGPLGWG